MASTRDLFGSDSDSDNDNLRISPDKDAAKSGDEAENPRTPGASQADSSDSDVGTHRKQQRNRSPVRLLADETDSEEERQQDASMESEKPTRSPVMDQTEDNQPVAVAAEMMEDEVETIIKDETLVRMNADFSGHFIHWKVGDHMRGETEAFDPEAYDDDFEDFEEDPAIEMQDEIRQKVLDRIRWRVVKNDDGTEGRESNARLIKWSDGTASVAIGDRYFDASIIPLKGEFQQLFLRQGTGLQGGVVFKDKMILRPVIPGGQMHRKAKVSAANATESSARRVVRIDTAKVPEGFKDPEKRRNELIKKEEERLKASIKRETQQRRVRERIMSRGITSSYLEGREDEEDENEISIAAIKSSYKRGEYNRQRMYSDEEDSEGEGRRKKLESAKDYDDDDDDDFGVKKKKTEESKKRAAVVSDSDED